MDEEIEEARKNIERGEFYTEEEARGILDLHTKSPTQQS